MDEEGGLGWEIVVTAWGESSKRDTCSAYSAG